MNPSHALGVFGEKQASRYLSELGWKILDRNVRMRCGELDIVAYDPEERQLVVVEVRSRSVGVMQPPETTVGPLKMRKLIKTGSLYVEKKGYDGNWRIDLIAVLLKNEKTNIEHYKDITYAYLM